MEKLPLLIEGFYSNANRTSPSVVPTPGTAVSWNNQIREGRGDMVMLDIVASGLPTVPTDNNDLGVLDLFIGSMVVIQQSELANYRNNSYIRSYELMQLRQAPGQTIALNLLPTDAPGAVVHVYYENRFATAAIIEARNRAILKQRTIEYRDNFLFGVDIAESQNFTVPTGMGNVVGIEFFAYNYRTNPGNCAYRSLLSCSVNGVSILTNAISTLFLPDSGRPGLIFPIFIRPGSTFSFKADTRYATSGEVVMGARLYFDDQL
jgi:hypothetical protein